MEAKGSPEGNCIDALYDAVASLNLSAQEEDELWIWLSMKARGWVRESYAIKRFNTEYAHFHRNAQYAGSQ